MKNNAGLGVFFIDRISGLYSVSKEDIGKDAILKKKGRTFVTESYAVENAGHLCVMKMSTIFGLMKMETVVFAPYKNDLPLINLDRVTAFGQELMVVELYDAQLEPYPQSSLDEFRSISDRSSDIPDYTMSFSADRPAALIPYSCSYHKKGKGISSRLMSAAKDYIEVYVSQFENAPDCDADEKKAKIRSFAETLFNSGGPAVDQVSELFGRDTAKRLLIHHIYGVNS